MVALSANGLDVSCSMITVFTIKKKRKPELQTPNCALNKEFSISFDLSLNDVNMNSVDFITFVWLPHCMSHLYLAEAYSIRSEVN